MAPSLRHSRWLKLPSLLSNAAPMCSRQRPAFSSVLFSSKKPLRAM